MDIKVSDQTVLVRFIFGHVWTAKYQIRLCKFGLSSNICVEQSIRSGCKSLIYLWTHVDIKVSDQT